MNSINGVGPETEKVVPGSDTLDLVLPEEQLRVCGEPAVIFMSDGTGAVAYLCDWCGSTHTKYVGWDEIKTNVKDKTCQAMVAD